MKWRDYIESMRLLLRTFVQNIVSENVFSSESVFYIEQSSILPSIEFYCDIWPGAPALDFEIHDKI